MKKTDRKTLQRLAPRKPTTLAADQRELTDDQLEQIAGGKIISIINSISL